MNKFDPPPMGEGGQRRSRQVAVVLLAAAGVVGLPLYMLHRDDARTSEDQWERPNADAVNVSAEQEYSNDAYVPNVGFYHAPYNAWYPFRYNYYDEPRGYYAGGSWRPQPEVSEIIRSRPSSVAIAAVLAAERERQRASPNRSSWGNSFSSGSTWHSTPRSRWSSPPTRSNSSPSSPGFTTSPSHSSVIRGGFGQSSSHSGSSSSS